MKIISSFLFLFAVLSSLQAAETRTETLLERWEFVRENPGGVEVAPPSQAEWKSVTVPHIFRQSGLPDNSAGWYRNIFSYSKDEAERHRHVFLNLEGAATVKDVFVNGKFIGQHKGAYTASTFDLTPALRSGVPNEVAVRVSNRDEECKGLLARSSLYYVNGGMFRRAWLVRTGAVHFASDLGSSGVYLTPENITEARADLKIRANVANTTAKPAEVVVRHTVSGPDGKVRAQFEARKILSSGATEFIEAKGEIAHPRLWNFGQPNLYTVRTEVLVDGQPSDELTDRTGFRTISIKGGKFFLNGSEIQIRGVNKHEQNEYAWNAAGEETRSEWKWLNDMGVNTVRLAHYPHSRLDYDLADESGVAVWAENGFAGQTWKGAWEEDKVVTPDGERMTREMMRQNWNHPSILFWSCGNETIIDTASRYAKVIRDESDAGRLVTYATNNDKSPENCDFVAKNTYDGWYGRHFSGFAQLPKNAFVSETGAGDWVTHHVPYGTVKWSVDKFEPEEYAEMFAEYRLQTVFRTDTAARPMFLWWNFREFYDKKFKGNRNTKGIVTMAGMPKDIYFLFKAFLKPEEPFVRLCGRHHFFRSFAPENGIEAYSNAAALELTINGVSQGKLANGAYTLPDTEKREKQKDAAGQPIEDKITSIPGIPVANVFFWNAPLAPGKNVITVSDGLGHEDRMTIYQRAPGMSMPADSKALIQEVTSSNPKNPADFINRPVEAQTPFYADVDGSSDNTFDQIPAPAAGASWIATRRLSDPELRTDIAFRVNPASAGAEVFVLFSTGTFPVVTLRSPDDTSVRAAAALADTLRAAGFQPVQPVEAVWRGHDLERADAALWRRVVKPGESISLPGQTLDYVVLAKPVAP